MGNGFDTLRGYLGHRSGQGITLVLLSFLLQT